MKACLTSANTFDLPVYNFSAPCGTEKCSLTDASDTTVSAESRESCSYAESEMMPHEGYVVRLRF